MRFKALPGFRDFYPEEMATRRRIEDAWQVASRRSGFQEIDGPILESIEVLEAKSGEEIAAQIYAFTDKGDRRVALRPEMTPTLARMVAARAGALPKPIKWYCVPEFFRYERQQRGRQRQFVQWNVDVIGAPEPAADVETMAVALDALRLLGLTEKDLVLRLNDRRFVRRMLQSLDVAPESEAEVLASIDKVERDPKAARRLEELVGDTRAKQVLAWCESLPVDEADEIRELVELCEQFGIRGFAEPDFKIARGFDYYTGAVWEIFDRARDLRSVAGGGRYDELIATMGGPNLPATGFGMGDSVLTELMAERGLLTEPPPPADVYVVPVGDEMLEPARRVVRGLRERGVSADTPYTSVKLARAFKAADRSGARRVVVVGPDEWADGSVRVRDMVSGDERVVRVEELE